LAHRAPFLSFINPIPAKYEPEPPGKPSYDRTWLPLPLGMSGYKKLALYTGVRIACTGAIFSDLNLPQGKEINLRWGK